MTRRVLVTGLSGLIGSAFLKHHGAAYDVRGLNRRPIAGVPVHQADIADLGAIRPAFEGVDTVVHLAAATGSPPWPAVLSANVIGTYNVFEAARAAGVARVIHASSGATVSGYEREPPFKDLVDGRYEALATVPRLTHESPPRPSGLYGASKLWGESLARHYADAHRMSMLCIRIGAVNASDRPEAMREFSVWCSQRDIAQVIARSIQAPPAVRFGIFFATSDNRWGYRDIAPARTVLGFQPLDRAEDFR